MKAAQLKPSAIEEAFIALNKRKYRKYSVFGVDKVSGAGAYPLVEFKDEQVFVNVNMFNRADFRNLLKVIGDEVEVIFVD